jgi:iron complex outermembrane receptor protein
VTRSDQTITAISFSRNAAPARQRRKSVLDAERDPNGTLTIWQASTASI